jgi:hypothetical protein
MLSTPVAEFVQTTLYHISVENILEYMHTSCGSGATEQIRGHTEYHILPHVIQLFGYGRMVISHNKLKCAFHDSLQISRVWQKCVLLVQIKRSENVICL